MSFKVGDHVIWTWKRTTGGNPNYGTYERTDILTAIVLEILHKTVKIQIKDSNGKTALVKPDSLKRIGDDLN